MYNNPNEGLTEEQAKLKQRYLSVLDELVRIQCPSKDTGIAEFKRINTPLAHRFYVPLVKRPWPNL